MVEKVLLSKAIIMNMNESTSAPKSKGWRNFDGLDLEKRPDIKQKNPLHGRIKGLDLAQSKVGTPVKVTARKMEAYAQRTAHSVKGPLFPAWARSMPEYGHAITTSPAIEETCESMEAKIQGEVSDVKGLDYNGLHVVTHFIEFCEQERQKDPKMNIVEIFQRFQPDSKDEASRTHGTTCVGKAWNIVNRLEEKGVEAHVIVESGKPDEPPVHAAVAVPCKDGILLVEVEHDLPILMLKSNKPLIIPHINLNVSFEIIEIPGNYKTPTPLIVRRENFEKETDRNSYAQFVLRPDTNADQSVMKRWLVSDHTQFYPVSSAKREGEEKYSLKVNVDRGKVTFNIGEKRFRLDMKDFDVATGTVDRSKLRGTKLVEDKEEEVALSKEDMVYYKNFILGMEGEALGGKFFEAFQTQKDLLIAQIFTVVAHQEMLNDLRKEAKKVK